MSCSLYHPLAGISQQLKSNRTKIYPLSSPHHLAQPPASPWARSPRTPKPEGGDRSGSVPLFPPTSGSPSSSHAAFEPAGHLHPSSKHCPLPPGQHASLRIDAHCSGPLRSTPNTVARGIGHPSVASHGWWNKIQKLHMTWPLLTSLTSPSTLPLDQALCRLWASTQAAPPVRRPRPLWARQAPGTSCGTLGFTSACQLLYPPNLAWYTFNIHYTD